MKVIKSDVFYIALSSGSSEERCAALKKLLAAVNPFSCLKEGEFLPVKITIGDAPCVYHVSPELVKLVIAYAKQVGVKPFLFDTSVIYQGERQNAVDHLGLAQTKGFGYTRVGAPFIIADGIFGQDGKEYALDSQIIKKIKVPSFVGMVDNLAVLSHVTGHIVSGYAGALKNVAMGMSCRATKQVQHSSLKPKIIEKKCTACGCCIKICPVKAIRLQGEKAYIDPQICLGCGECLCACKFNSIFINWHEEPQVFCRRMVEVAAAILSKFKNKIFFNFAFDITKECDCISAKNEEMIALDCGIFASQDPVSLDKACADAAFTHKKSSYLDKAKNVYEGMLEYAEEKGVGSLAYNLIVL